MKSKHSGTESDCQLDGTESQLLEHSSKHTGLDLNTMLCAENVILTGLPRKVVCSACSLKSSSPPDMVKHGVGVFAIVYSHAAVNTVSIFGFKVQPSNLYLIGFWDYTYVYKV